MRSTEDTRACLLCVTAAFCPYEEDDALWDGDEQHDADTCPWCIDTYGDLAPTHDDCQEAFDQYMAELKTREPF